MQLLLQRSLQILPQTIYSPAPPALWTLPEVICFDIGSFALVMTSPLVAAAKSLHHQARMAHRQGLEFIRLSSSRRPSNALFGPEVERKLEQYSHEFGAGFGCRKAGIG